MSTKVLAVTPNQSADRAWAKMRLQSIRHLVVMDGREVLGIISDRDLGGRHGASVRKGHTVEDLMARQVVSATPNTTLRQAANLMRGRTIGCLPVIEEGRLLGIVTITDILDQLGRGSTRPLVRGDRRVQRSHASHHRLGGTQRVRPPSGQREKRLVKSESRA